MIIIRSENKHSLSVTSNKLKDKNGCEQPIRLKGGMFRRDFIGIQCRAPIKDLASYKYTVPFIVNRRLSNNERTWQEGIKLKADYHQVRYTDAIAPEPLPPNKPKNIEPHDLSLPSRNLRLSF